jgi:glycosyltransferase involved in cell wall biosynthesis
MKLISILFPTYNGEKFINFSLQSILNQNHKELQIVIIDDGSTDNTLEKISSFKDSRIKLHAKEHTGLADSLNYGLSKVTAELIIRADQDDISLPNRIEEQYKFINTNPEYGIVGTNFFSVDKNGKLLQKVKYPEKHEYIIDQLPRKCCISHGSILIRKDLLLAIEGYDSDLMAAEDWDLFLRLIGKTKFYNLQKYFVHKKLHDTNMSSTKKAARISEQVMLKYSKKIITESDDILRKSKAYFDIGYHYYYKGDFKIADEYFEKATINRKNNFQILRYYLSSKYLKRLIALFRKNSIYRVFDLFRFIDRNNKIFRNKF